jgi:hypothetical protein
MRWRTVLAICVMVGLGAVGCGGTDGGSAAETPAGDASANPNNQEAHLKFAQCMRDNGVPMDDPKVDADGNIQMNLDGDGVDPATAKAAEAKCKKLLPNGGETGKADPAIVEQLRKFSKCMRENGLPDFPDPTDKGLQVDGNKFSPTDPKVKAAEAKCKKYQPAPKSGESPGLTEQK